jgi:hypothetical protein
LKFLAAVLTAFLLSAATAEATSSGGTIRYAGAVCQGGGGSVNCVPLGGSGYGIAINSELVLVMNLDTGRRVFVRYQP